MMIAARVLNPGTAEGPVLVVDEPLSFWGAFDPLTGVIVEGTIPSAVSASPGKLSSCRRHAARGVPRSIAEAIRRGTAPLALILMKPDVNLPSPWAVSLPPRFTASPARLPPVDASGYRRLSAAAYLTIGEDGSIESHAAIELSSSLRFSIWAFSASSTAGSMAGGSYSARSRL